MLHTENPATTQDHQDSGNIGRSAHLEAVRSSHSCGSTPPASTALAISGATDWCFADEVVLTPPARALHTCFPPSMPETLNLPTGPGTTHDPSTCKMPPAVPDPLTVRSATDKLSAAHVDGLISRG